MRLKLTLAYVGNGYAGWQRQPDEPTVQAALESALATVAGHTVTAYGASRTDAGVHAAGQVAHADLDGRLDPAAWLAALNANLPDDIRVGGCERAADDFHARYGARSKSYRYSIDEHSVASPFLAPFAWHLGSRLDLDAMHAAADALCDPRLDQRTFATRPEKGDRPRPLQRVEIERGRLLTITVVGQSFLRYAVRGMVGTLVEVGRGRRDAGGVGALARSGDRAAAAATAPAHGLCLAAIDYATSRGGIG